MAEDEGLIRRLMAKLLDAQGHKVFEAEDGETALEFFRSERPDVVITDIRMPAMDGIALMREVRAVAPEAEVILITGFAETDLVIEALRKGASNFLAKPFHFDSLIAQVEPSLSRLELRRENERLRQEPERARRREEEEARGRVMARLLAGLAREVHILLNLAAGSAECLRHVADRGRDQGRLVGEDLAEAGRFVGDLEFCLGRVRALVRDVDQFLTLRENPDQQTASLTEAVDGALAAVESQRPGQVHVTLALPKPDATALCDPEDLVGCLTHVIRNSYEALATGGSALRVSAAVTPFPAGPFGGFIEMVVEDDGPGIPQGIIDEVFAPFFSTREAISASGSSWRWNPAAETAARSRSRAARGREHA